MNMQPKRGQFGTSKPIKVGSYEEEVRPYADFKRGKAEGEMKLSVSNLAAASKRITADYPDLAAWYCLHVAIGSEQTVEKQFKAAHVECVVPVWKGEKFYRRGMLVARPDRVAVSGYVFVRVVLSPACVAALIGEKLVSDIVGGPANPHRIADEEMSSFIAMCQCGKVPKVEDDCFEVGDWLWINDGPFATFNGTLLSKNSGEGLLEIPIAGRVAKISMPLAFLAKP